MCDIQDTIANVQEQSPVYRIETSDGVVLDVVRGERDAVPRKGDILQAQVHAGAPPSDLSGWRYAAQGTRISPEMISCGGLLFRCPRAAAAAGGDAPHDVEVCVLATWAPAPATAS